MGLLKVGGMVHWSIAVNNIDESEKFYRDILGLEFKGRLGAYPIAYFTAGDDKILLCERKEPLVRDFEKEGLGHQAFTVTPEVFDRACKVFKEHGVPVVQPSIAYRHHGVFLGRELYFLDPSGNKLELCDPTWRKGMPEPTYEEIVGS